METVVAIDVVGMLMNGYSFTDFSLIEERGPSNEFGLVEVNFVSCFEIVFSYSG